MPVFQLSEKIGFPPPHLAEKEGVLAVGGDLSPRRLLLAYKMGIFPWYCEDEPIIWWSPDPRLILYPSEIIVSSSLKKIIKKGIFQITMDRAFEKVICECASVRTENGMGTWIVDDMIRAYCRMHEQGYAHSVETWMEGRLVGGLYGLSLGGAFFGESMFMRVSNASKIAFVKLVRQLAKWDFDLIDCQVHTRHLSSLGAREIPRKIFLTQLEKSLKKNTRMGPWSFDA